MDAARRTIRSLARDSSLPQVLQRATITAGG